MYLTPKHTTARYYWKVNIKIATNEKYSISVKQY